MHSSSLPTSPSAKSEGVLVSVFASLVVIPAGNLLFVRTLAVLEGPGMVRAVPLPGSSRKISVLYQQAADSLRE
jgi:hypothetical protein